MVRDQFSLFCGLFFRPAATMGRIMDEGSWVFAVILAILFSAPIYLLTSTTTLYAAFKNQSLRESWTEMHRANPDFQFPPQVRQRNQRAGVDDGDEPPPAQQQPIPPNWRLTLIVWATTFIASGAIVGAVPLLAFFFVPGMIAGATQ